MAGILYFARLFRFAHDALEDMLEAEGVVFDTMFTTNAFFFVIAHCEGNYYMPLTAGERLEVHLVIEKFGTTSFHINYNIYRKSELVGSVKTVHVCLNSTTRQKMEIPTEVRKKFSKYLANSENS
jgi:1,4-dihydroxy-2-naphthoyl-CoA hydrolase